MAMTPHPPQTRVRVIEEFLACGRVDIACQRAGVDRGCHYDWLKAYPEYKEAFELARRQTADLLEDEAWRRAVEGVDKPVFQGGEMVGKIREYSDTLMTWLLRGMRPERYKDKVDVDLTHHAGESVVAILRGRIEQQKQLAEGE